MKRLDLSARLSGGIDTTVTTEMVKPKNKWEEELIEISAHIDGMYIFTGGIWFRCRGNALDFPKTILEGQFQWFIEIISYLKFVIV